MSTFVQQCKWKMRFIRDHFQQGKTTPKNVRGGIHRSLCKPSRSGQNTPLHGNPHYCTCSLRIQRLSTVKSWPHAKRTVGASALAWFGVIIAQLVTSWFINTCENAFLADTSANTNRLSLIHI